MPRRMDTAKPQDDTARIPSATFEALAVARGLITPAQVDEARELLQVLVGMGLGSNIAEVFLKKGWLDAPQVASIQSSLGNTDALVIPGYEVVEKIAEGGMGAVYKARQLSMNRFVAIKVLLPRYAADKEGRERFVREAHAVAKLSHPNVVAGIDAGVSQGVCYFVMEYLDGEPLDQVLRRRGSMPWREATTLIRHTAAALDHAHRHGIVHRDVKPSNIMLLRDGTAKLADLGLARLTESTDQSLTQSGMLVGSPAYISPEQATGDRSVDIRSDIFSLGLTFFELICGERAYAGSNPMSLMTALLTRDVPLDKLRSLDAPSDVIAVIARMAQRESARRYANPQELIEDLDALLAGAAPAHALASPKSMPGNTESPGRASRRHWVVATIAAVLVAALAAGAWIFSPRPLVAASQVAPPVESLSPVPGLRIDLVGAIERAERELAGAPAYHAELERDEYSVDLVAGKRTLNVVIDAIDGRVKQKLDEDEDHRADIERLGISLREATQIAERATGLRAVEAAVLLLPGQVVIETKLLREGKPVWIDVDGESGAPSTERRRRRRI